MHVAELFLRRVYGLREGWTFSGRELARALRRSLPLRPPVIHRGIVVPAVALLLGLAVSFAALYAVRHIYLAEAKEEFETPAAQVAGVVGQTLRQHMEVTESVSAFLAASKEMDRWAFFEFARDTLSRYPGVSALAWVPRVPGADRPAFEERARNDGLFGFEFQEPHEGTEPRPAEAREEHFPLYYVEPFEGNEQLLGLDLAGSPRRLDLLQQARDLGQMITTRGAAPEAGGTGSDLSVVLPVYVSGAVPKTLQQRREELRGFVWADLDLQRLIAAALPGPAAPPGLDIYVYDEEAGPRRRLMAFYPSPLRQATPLPRPEKQVRDGLFGTTHYEFGGRQWSIWVKPVDSLLRANITVVSWGAFFVGLILTLSLVQYLVSSQNRTRMIERAVTKRTAELREANEALQSEILERERIERELRAEKERAQIANRAKTDFLAMMSHELRTPLNAVIGFSEFLCQETFGPLGDKRYREYAGDIRKSGEELLKRINDILQLTKVEAEEFSLSEEEVDLSHLLEAVLGPVREQASEAELNLRTRMEGALPLLRADPRALKQILINILSNAVKFTPAGGEISFRAGQDADGNVLFETADTGIGIDPQHLALVLQPFTQVDTSLARKYEGSGIGLALTHRLVRMHGGKLEIDSELGAGTTVRVILPAERVLAGDASSQVA